MANMLDKFKQKIEIERSKGSLGWKPLFFIKDHARKFIKFFEKPFFQAEIIGKEAIYFWINKSSSSSLRLAFSGSLEKSKKIKKDELYKYDKYFKFTFVRNPYDRLVSCYQNQINSTTSFFKKNFLNGMYREFWRYNGKFFPGMKFKQFVREVYSIPDKKSNNHFKSQYKFIEDSKGEIGVDFVGRVENLEEDYKTVCQKLNLDNPSKLPKKNKTKKRKSYRDYYDEETKKLVEERYKRDIELFNYEF